MARFDRIRRLPERHPTRTVVAAGLVLVFGVALFVSYMQIALLAKTEALADALTARADSAFVDVRPLSDAELRSLRTYLNKKHVARAQSLGVSGLSTREAAQDFVSANELVLLETNGLYHVEPMDYSVPYVTESTAHLLALIGQRFQEALRAEGLPPYKFVITSATRSEEDQKALRRINGNAVPVSSHNYGTTVDIHYRKFFYAPTQDTLPDQEGILRTLLREQLETDYANLGQAYHSRLEALLGRVLLDLQREGKVLVIYERRQPVFHITVGSRVRAPDAVEVAASSSAVPSAEPDASAGP